MHIEYLQWHCCRDAMLHILMGAWVFAHAERLFNQSVRVRVRCRLPPLRALHLIDSWQFPRSAPLADAVCTFIKLTQFRVCVSCDNVQQEARSFLKWCHLSTPRQVQVVFWIHAPTAGQRVLFFASRLGDNKSGRILLAPAFYGSAITFKSPFASMETQSHLIFQPGGHVRDRIWIFHHIIK